MSVFDTVQAVRPEVAPMPLADRRMIRETLFGVGHQDASHSIGERSASGAVVSTAPHGTRVPLRSRPRSTGSLVRMVAGLLVLALPLKRRRGAGRFALPPGGQIQPHRSLDGARMLGRFIKE